MKKKNVYLIQDKTSGSHYKYTIDGQSVFTGDIRLCMEFKYSISAYFVLLYRSFYDCKVIKIDKNGDEYKKMLSWREDVNTQE